jgi:PDZ domain
MQFATRLCRAGLLGAFATTIGINTALADEPEPPAAREGAEVRREALPRVRHEIMRKVLINDVAASSKYWLDMKLTGVPKALDAQLQLEGAGALVADVGTDGPAAEAGIKTHDVVMAVGDKPIKRLPDLVDEIDKSEGKEVSLKILRGGKPITLTITPVERAPAGKRGEQIEEDVFTLPGLGNIDINEIEETIRGKLENAGVDVRMLLIEPGKFLPKGTGFEVEKLEFPDDLTVQISKNGKEPAQIEVKQGDETWTATEDKLDELPDEVRRHVKGLLGRSTARFAIAGPGGRKFTVPLPAPRASAADDDTVKPDVQNRQRLRGSLERRFDEMNRDFSRMRERMDELRKTIRDLEGDEKPDDDR